MTAQELAALAAGLSAFAALGSVLAAWRVPYSVAKQNEAVRKSNETRSRKFTILETLMQHRATISARASVGAINSVPIVFSSSSKVLDAHKRFMGAANAKPFENATLIERYLGLINAVIADLGLDGEIPIGVVDSAYFPEGLGKLELASFIEADAKVQGRLSANNDPRGSGHTVTNSGFGLLGGAK